MGFKDNWVSRRFKTEENRQWHTDMCHKDNRSLDELQKEYYETNYGLKAEIFATHCIRLTDGKKKLDIYPSRYFKVDTGERGGCDYFDRDKIIQEYFNIKTNEKT